MLSVVETYCFFEEGVASIFRTPWIWQRNFPLKYLYHTAPYCDTNSANALQLFTGVTYHAAPYGNGMFYIFWAPRGEIVIPSVFCVKHDVLLLQRTINRQCLEIGCSGYLYISESNATIASFYICAECSESRFTKKRIRISLRKNCNQSWNKYKSVKLLFCTFILFRCLSGMCPRVPKKECRNILLFK